MAEREFEVSIESGMKCIRVRAESRRDAADKVFERISEQAEQLVVITVTDEDGMKEEF